MPQAKKHQKKFEGFDYLRAFFAIVIVAYKSNIVYIPELLFPGGLTNAFSAYVLSGAVGALAVPVFLQISLFLFGIKSETQGLSYFIKKRLPKLIYLYFFWVSLVTIFDALFFAKIDAINSYFSSLKKIFEFIVSGNSTPYFFFFSLIFVTIISEIFILLFAKIDSSATKLKLNYGLLFASLALIFLFSVIEPFLEYTGIQSSSLNVVKNITEWDYSPINFLPYVFTAAITAQEYKVGRLDHITPELKRKLSGLMTLSLIFFALEWILTSNRLLIQVDQAPLDHYLRLSLVFGSWFFLYLALLIERKAPAVIKFLSDCSLGIYGFHVFFTFKHVFPLNLIPFLKPLFTRFPLVEIFANFTLAVVGSIALTLVLKRIKPLKQFV